MIYPSPYTRYKPESYSSYKKRKFHEKTEKLRMLIGSIDELSLKDEDKEKLKSKFLGMINNSFNTK